MDGGKRGDGQAPLSGKKREMQGGVFSKKNVAGGRGRR